MSSIPNEYYTPRTYGIEGLTFKGFNIDDIFVPGSNGRYLRTQNPTMWDLLKFHITRSILNGLLAIVSFYESLPSFFKQLTLFRLSFSRFEEFEKIFTSLFKKDKANRVEINSTKNPPEHLATVLKSSPHISPPLPTIPQSIELADGSVAAPTAEELEEIHYIIQKEESQKVEHHESETKRLIDETTELILWSIKAGITQLTIFESSGTLCEQEVERVVTYCREKMALADIPLGEKPIKLCFHTQSREVLFDNASFTTGNKQLNPFNETGLGSRERLEPNGHLLQVNVLEEDDTCKSLTQFTKLVTEELENGNITQDIVYKDDEILSRAFRYFITGNERNPDILILFKSNSDLGGYPTYGLKDTMIYCDRTHKSASPDLRVFNDAIKEFCKM